MQFLEQLDWILVLVRVLRAFLPLVCCHDAAQRDRIGVDRIGLNRVGSGKQLRLTEVRRRLSQRSQVGGVPCDLAIYLEPFGI